MKRKDESCRRASLALLILSQAALILASSTAHTRAQEARPGQPPSPSQQIYDGWTRVSQYITARDGTRLAADILRPTIRGAEAREPLPIIWAHDRYHRATLDGGKLVTQLKESPWLEKLIRHGYIIGVVDARGTGASFGKRRGELTPEEARDAYDITEWFAAQPWCNGRVGMFGRSYLGIAQYLAASTAPPHLVAIFPEMAMFDLYSFMYPGGVFREDYARNWGSLVRRLDTNGSAAAVDKDADGSMLAQAVKHHEENIDVFSTVSLLPYRDSKDPKTGRKPFSEWSPSNYLAQVNRSGVAIYCVAGWFDLWSRDSLVWFNNLQNPRRIVIGPWAHTDSSGFDLATEHLRWYDYWLKGIDDGISKEPPVRYYTVGAPQGKEWRSAWKWPLPDQELTNFYFEAEPSGKAESTNDGLLADQPPTSSDGQDDYVVDYSTTSGNRTRWTNGYGGQFGYRDMSANDAKALTYTSSPLSRDLEITGHPVVHLWVKSSAKDGDFFVYLEEVDQHGYSEYITEGVLRASHKAVSTPHFNYLGLPYHRSFLEDISDLPKDQPVELVIDLHPVSNVFEKSNHIRVSITGADKDNALTQALSPPPVVTISRNSKNASYITLPVIPNGAEAGGEDELPTSGQGIAGEGMWHAMKTIFSVLVIIVIVGVPIIWLIKK